MLCYNRIQHDKKVKNATYIAFKMRFLRFLHLVCDYYTRKNQNTVSGFLWKKRRQYEKIEEISGRNCEIL